MKGSWRRGIENYEQCGKSEFGVGSFLWSAERNLGP